MDFIAIRQYNNYIVANIAKGLLEDHDITCYLQDETIGTVMPHLNIGGIKLLIPLDKKENAEVLLKNSEDQLTDEDFEMGFFSN